MEKGEGGRDLTQLYVDGLKHPMRREILRLAVRTNEPVSPAQASQLFDEHVSNVSYHVRVLANHGLMTLAFTRRVRGAIEHFYAPQPAALEHPVVKAFLEHCCDSPES